MTRRAILTMAIPLLLLAPLSPAGASCTRVGAVRVGECDSGSAKQREASSPSAGARTARARAAERDLLALLNAERARSGLLPLRPSPMLENVSRRHARRMQERGRIYHNSWIFSPDGRRALGYPARLGENVGVEHSARRLHQGFVDSPRHRRRVLDPGYTRIGIGVFERYGSYWAVEVFARWGPLPAVTRLPGGATSSGVPAATRLFSDFPNDAPEGRLRGRRVGASAGETAARVGGWVLVGLLGAGALATLFPGGGRRRRA